jgi:hypothetical protein
MSQTLPSLVGLNTTKLSAASGGTLDRSTGVSAPAARLRGAPRAPPRWCPGLGGRRAGPSHPGRGGGGGSRTGVVCDHPRWGPAALPAAPPAPAPAP